MSTVIANGSLSRSGRTGAVSNGRLIAVVGFDGTESAKRALDAAAKLIDGRIGSLEVVFVAHPPVAAPMVPYGQAEIRQTLDAEADQLRELVRAQLGDEQRWHFTRRDGSTAAELSEIARETAAAYEPDTLVMIVVGRATHAYHHVVGSVPVALVRHEEFPVLVIP
jgi:nucleotide-binding universal stress UspA family protein